MARALHGFASSRAAYRQSVRRYFACCALYFSAIGLLNYVIDPLWLFSHSHVLNRRQTKIDERQQKANQLKYGKQDFDAILLGSSRCTFISHYDFKGYSLYNLSVDAMLPKEYYEYIKFASKQSRPGLKLIVLGLDFYATNENFRGYGQRNPQDYFRATESRSYRIGSLIAFDTLRYSITNVYKSLSPPAGIYYSRDNVKALTPAANKYKLLAVQEDLRIYREKMYGRNYRYKDLTAIFRAIRQANPGVRIVAFTTPTSRPLWELLLEQGRLDDYCRWIGDIVGSFGEVYDFMGINSVTANSDNYNDGHHFYPHVGTLIAHRILSIPDPRLSDDFGQHITGANLDRYISEVKLRNSKEFKLEQSDRGN